MDGTDDSGDIRRRMIARRTQFRLFSFSDEDERRKMMSKKFYAIFHGVDEDGGFGDAVYTENMMGVVEATREEIDAFVEKWNKPTVYDEPYAQLTCHNVRAEEIKICDPSTLNPYGKDDCYGLFAKLHEFKEAFEAQHGDRWNYSNKRDELYELYFKGQEEIRRKHEEEHNESV